MVTQYSLIVLMVITLVVHCDEIRPYQRSILPTNPQDVRPIPTAGQESHKNKQYPFLIVSPPDLTKNEEDLNDAQGSKYYTNKRQSVAYPTQQMTSPLFGFIPLYYMVPQYPTVNQAFYTNYSPYQDNGVLDSQYLQFATNNDYVQPMYNTDPYNGYLKRSNTMKNDERVKLSPRQMVPRHHWAFSQWPFDSHEYAFTKHPYLSHMRHPPRWGPSHWGGVGPKEHWGMNREGLPSPFGIGLAPHMGGQGYMGLDGHWPAGHGFPMATNFPKSPFLQQFAP